MNILAALLTKIEPRCYCKHRQEVLFLISKQVLVIQCKQFPFKSAKNLKNFLKNVFEDIFFRDFCWVTGVLKWQNLYSLQLNSDWLKTLNWKRYVKNGRGRFHEIQIWVIGSNVILLSPSFRTGWGGISNFDYSQGLF